MKRLQLISRKVIGSQKKLMICSIKTRRQKNFLMNKEKQGVIVWTLKVRFGYEYYI